MVFSDTELCLCFGCVFASILFVFATYGIAPVLMGGGLYYYYYWEREQDRKARSKIEKLWADLETLRKEIKLLWKFDSYLTTPAKMAFETPLEKAMMELLKMPDKFDHHVEPIANNLDSFLTFLQRYNEAYIIEQKSRHAEFFNGLDYHDGYGFNERQARAILTNDINNLIIAGPGAGKTRVLTSRAAFFAHRKGVAPREILILAYNKRTVNEIRSRLKHRFGIEGVEVTTFHSLGLRILKAYDKTRRDTNVESEGEATIKEIVDKLVKTDYKFQAKYLSYVSAWGVPEELAAMEPELMDERFRHRLHEFYRALNGRKVGSLAERDIANYFLQHGIPFEYEPEVTWCDKDPDEPKRTYHPDFYLSEYDIYLEHWAVSSDCRPPDFFSAEDTMAYFEGMCWKREQFQKHGKTLWETNHTLFAENNLIPTLEQNLAEIGVQPQRLSYPELLRKIGLQPGPDKAVRDTIAEAIKTAKVYGHSPKSLALHVQSANDRQKKRQQVQFICDIVLPVFKRYETKLQEHGEIDFEDMINLAIGACKLIKSENDRRTGFGPYKLILVDEFQDISEQRLQFLRALQQLAADCRLFCVGDDWQAIYGFAGSSTRHMIRFESSSPALARVDLEQNYRNPSQILEFSMETINGCSEKISKILLPRNIDETEIRDSSLIFKRFAGSNEYDFKSCQNEVAFKLIEDLISSGVDPAEILVLSRFNHGYGDLRRACNQHPKIPVELIREGQVNRPGARFMTVHRSKGLEAEYVLVLNAFKGVFGFPSEIKSRLNFDIINPDLPDLLDEERRLLFVAITRAKKRCVVFTWAGQESKFLVENEHFLNQFRVPEVPVFEGRILDERDRAYNIEASLSPSFKPTFWVPKSQVSLEVDNGTKTFKLKDWWYKKEILERWQNLVSFSS